MSSSFPQPDPTAVPLEERSLSVEELARACAIDIDWVVERTSAGLLTTHGERGTEVHAWRYASAALVRTRCMVSMERDMDANPEVAALVADLVDEVRRLRRRLRAAGLTDPAS